MQHYKRQICGGGKIIYKNVLIFDIYICVIHLNTLTDTHTLMVSL